MSSSIALENHQDKAPAVVVDHDFAFALALQNKFLQEESTTSLARQGSKAKENGKISLSHFPLQVDYTAPETLDASVAPFDSMVEDADTECHSKQMCPVCSTSLFSSSPTIPSNETTVVKYRTCGHTLHRRCASYVHSQGCATCPKCFMPVQTHRGVMPSGSMRVCIDPLLRCRGSEHTGVLVLHYTISAGRQKHYHLNAGTPHGSTNRTAYLPNTEAGRSLLKRLICAFQHGLTFSVGTSLATGKPNSVVWSKIGHKTNLDRGPKFFGFPDDSYFLTCNNELDALGVPRSCRLRLPEVLTADTGVITPEPMLILPCVLQYNAPDSFANATDIASMVVKVTSIDRVSSKSECPLCLEVLDCLHGGSQDQDVVALKCGHRLHHHCAVSSIKNDTRCPMCRAQVTEPRGKMPSGTMNVSISNVTHCAGFGSTTTIIIDYTIRGGVQKEYHEHPGCRHGSTIRRAYVPNTIEGKRLTKRLIYAFEHGLTFTVGTSMTTGKTNQVVWSSIHHKTRTAGGQANHGYPDDGYFHNCNEELDAAGVPKVE